MHDYQSFQLRRDTIYRDILRIRCSTITGFSMSARLSVLWTRPAPHAVCPHCLIRFESMLLKFALHLFFTHQHSNSIIALAIPTPSPATSESYVTLKLISDRGSFGDVFYGRDTTKGVQVAIKKGVCVSNTAFVLGTHCIQATSHVTLHVFRNPDAQTSMHLLQKQEPSSR